MTFQEPPRICWKGPIKTSWIIFTIFSRLLFQLVGCFDEVNCSGSTLCWKKSRHERVSPIHWDKSMCESNNSIWSTIWESFVKRLLQHAATWNSKWSKILSIVRFHGQVWLQTLHLGPISFPEPAILEKEREALG